MSTYYIGSIPVSSELYHYGIKGQKWGVRRYQNEDGTRTDAGKKRYGNRYIRPGESGLTGLRRKIQRRTPEEDDRIKTERKERREARKRLVRDAANVHKMSDAELLARIGRLQNEKRFMELTYDQLTSSADPAKQTMIKAGKKALEIALPGAALYAGYGVVTGSWNPADMAKYVFPNPNQKKK